VGEVVGKKFRIDFNQIVLGAIFLIIGILVYLFLRNPADVFFLQWINFADYEQYYINQSRGSNYFIGSLPTFIHVISLSLLTLGVIHLPKNKQWLVPLFWFSINVLFEAFQLMSHSLNTKLNFENIGIFLFVEKYFVNGVFDWADILFGFVGFLAIIIYVEVREERIDRVNKSIFCMGNDFKFYSVFMGIIGIGSIMGSSTGVVEDYHPNYWSDQNNEPVYMSYSELRTSIYTEEEKNLSKIGKIYVYKNYLLVNSENNGVFVYDNTHQSDPILVTFINIPGNVDIAIKQDILYVDSYIDLVVIDISDIQNIREIDRIENVFLYNAYQNIPDDIYIGYVDEAQGVVIGYKEKQDNDE